MDIRDDIINFTEKLTGTKIFTIKEVLRMIGISRNKYYKWQVRKGKNNKHNGKIPKRNWTLPEEKEAVIKYVLENYPLNSMFLKTGYRRIAYEMLDKNIVALKPSVVYRILKDAGLLNRWSTKKKSSKGKGFTQPVKPHEQWHSDIKYVNLLGIYIFLITVMDGYSRYILHHELRFNMTKYDVELTIQKAREKYPEESPRLISDNGSQYVSKDFEKFLKEISLQHTKTSISYPQSNGKIERFHRTIGEECLRTNSMLSIDDAKKIISEYIRYYNTHRLHSSLYYLTPEDFLLGRVEARIKEREEKIQAAIIRRTAYWSKRENVA